MPLFKQNMKSVFREWCNDSSSKYYVDYNVEIPSLEKHSVLIQVKACALSEISDKVLRDLFKKTLRSRFPVGQDVAGVVKQVGSEVETLGKGDEVVGIIPLDYNVSGCADYVVLNEFDVVKKPERISFVDAAGCIGDALKAYTALHYLGRLNSGDTVLVLDGASSFGSLTVQLALHWGARVIGTASSEDEKLYLKGIEPELALVIDMSKKDHSLKNICLEETGGLGVDIAIDNGVAMFSKEEEEISINENHSYHCPNKHDIISSLTVGGRWITCAHNLQLDPPNSRMMYMKCASLGFLFEHAWTLSSAQQGRYQHILMDIMEKVAEETIRPNIHHTVPFESIPEAIRRLPEIRVGKVIAVV